MKKIKISTERSQILFLACGIFFLSALICCSARGKKIQFPQNLIWPSPPDTPRIKFLAAVSSENDVGGIRKRSFADLILGRDPSKKIRRLRQPYGVATDSGGRIYVVDSGQAMVFVFDLENEKVSFIGQQGRSRLSWPIGVAVDKQNLVYVSDANHKNVLIFNPDHSFKQALAKKGDFSNPAGLAIDARKNRILVVDTKAHDVKVFDTTGKFIVKFGERGSQEGQFNFPTNVAIGSDGYIYIVDTGNHRVQVFDQNYEYYDDFGTLGRHPGQFRRPKGVALDSENHIYVIDSDFNNFQIFNQEYQILMPVGHFGKDYGQFWLPAGIHIDGQDRIYVVDTMNRRVQIFQYLGQPGSD